MAQGVEIPGGYADISVPLLHDLSHRTAFITFGMQAVLTTPESAADAAWLSLAGTGSLRSKIDDAVMIGPLTCRLGQTGLPPLIGVGSFSGKGTANTTSPAANTAALVSKRTGRGGRRGRGRMYIPWCLEESYIDEVGSINMALHGNQFQTMLNTWLAAMKTAGIAMHVLHRPGLSATGAPNEVTSLHLDPIVGSQRRRLGR